MSIELANYSPEHMTNYRGYTIFLRTVMGTPKGYVLIKQGQNGYNYDKDYEDSSIYCHGGITWDALTDAGRVIGWDSKHAGDYMPLPNSSLDCHVWTDEEAIDECKHIVDQLIEM